MPSSKAILVPKHSGTAWDRRNTVFTCSWSTRENTVVQAQPAIRWKGGERGRLYRILPPNELVTELRRRFLQCGDQIMGSRRNGARLPVNDLLRIGGFAIEFVIGFIVRPKG